MEYLNNSLEAVKDWLNDDNDIVVIHNEYCELANYPDDTVYYNDEEFINMNFHSVVDAVKAVSNNDNYNYYNDDFVIFDGCGNLKSSDNIEDLIDIDELAQYIYDNPQDFDIEFEEE